MRNDGSIVMSAKKMQPLGPRRLGLEPGGWLLVLLVLLTLLPSAGVLWFMNAAVTSESAAAQQRVMEAYRGQLRLVRARLDPLWRAHVATLDATGSPERQFERLITQEHADGAVILDVRGGVLYPERSDTHAATVVDDESRRVEEVARRLNDYSIPIPARSRLRMMNRLRARAPNVFLGTQAALALSIELVDAGRLMPMPDVIHQTSIPDIWALSSASGRVVALYRTGRIEEMMHDFLHLIDNAGIVFVAFPPDEPADPEAITAGPWLPGWQVSFVPLDAAERRTAEARRRTTYVAAGLAGVALIVLVGAAVGRTTRRHLQVARLKTDLVAAASHELRTPLASMRAHRRTTRRRGARSCQDARVSPAAKRRERAADAPHRKLPHVLAPRRRPNAVRLRRHASGSDCDGRGRRGPQPAATIWRLVRRHRAFPPNHLRRRAGADDGACEPARKRHQVFTGRSANRDSGRN
jgi:signal transduction histidine kinase